MSPRLMLAAHCKRVRYGQFGGAERQVNCLRWSGNYLLVNPATTATGVTVEHLRLPGVLFSASHGVPYSNVTMLFQAVNFPPFQLNGQAKATFREIDAGPTDLTIDDGSWSNVYGGLNSGKGETFSITGSPVIK